MEVLNLVVGSGASFYFLLISSFSFLIARLIASDSLNEFSSQYIDSIAEASSSSLAFITLNLGLFVGRPSSLPLFEKLILDHLTFVIHNYYFTKNIL